MISRLLGKFPITKGSTTGLRPIEYLRRYLSGIRSASRAYDLYCEVKRRGVRHDQASKIAASAFHEDRPAYEPAYSTESQGAPRQTAVAQITTPTPASISG